MLALPWRMMSGRPAARATFAFGVDRVPDVGAFGVVVRGAGGDVERSGPDRVAFGFAALRERRRFGDDLVVALKRRAAGDAAGVHHGDLCAAAVAEREALA